MQARSTHRSAVRAVFLEMANNMAVLDVSLRGTSVTAKATIDTSAYDGLLVPLYSRLPPRVASSVAIAYGLLHAFKTLPVAVATERRETILAATNALREYATKHLKLSFPPTDSG